MQDFKIAVNLVQEIRKELNKFFLIRHCFACLKRRIHNERHQTGEKRSSTYIVYECIITSLLCQAISVRYDVECCCQKCLVSLHSNILFCLPCSNFLPSPNFEKKKKNIFPFWLRLYLKRKDYFIRWSSPLLYSLRCRNDIEIVTAIGKMLSCLLKRFTMRGFSPGFARNAVWRDEWSCESPKV